MKKQASTLSKQQPTVIVEERPFGQVFLLKRDNSITLEPGMPEGKEMHLAPISEEEMQKVFFANRPALFGEATVGLNAQTDDHKRIWDAIIFDFSTPEDPRGYLVKIAKGITNGMLSMIELNTFMESPEFRTPLIQELSVDIRKDKTRFKIFKSFVVEGHELEDMLEHVIRRYLRVLFILNEDDADCAKLYRSYAEARAGTIDLIFLRKYEVGKSRFLSVTPPYSEIRQKNELKALPKEKKPRQPKVEHTEDHHFGKGSGMVKAIYEKLKREACKIAPKMQFNPSGKHYIAMKVNGGKNLAFMHFRKGGLYTVVKIDEKIVRKLVKKNTIHSLPPSVQKFWNGSSTGITITSLDNMKEIGEVLKKLIKG